MSWWDDGPGAGLGGCEDIVGKASMAGVRGAMCSPCLQWGWGQVLARDEIAWHAR